jgi:pimeloyl-ACP methyl ester carboxylesterase
MVARRQQQARAMMEAVDRPIWSEALVGAEWLTLRTSPIYSGRGVPHGDGDPVLLVPGFLAGDGYFFELRGWLRRIGYRTYASGIDRNVGCPDGRARDLVRRVREIHRETKRAVTIVGHSLGGMIARSVAERASGAVRRVVTLGSPFRGVRAHPLVLNAAAALAAGGPGSDSCGASARCMTSACTCPFARLVRDPDRATCDRRAIYSQFDGVVDPDACKEGDASLNREVRSTHVGMAFNRDVYGALAECLAE